nr:ubiquinol-cytochrome C chaperone family protein [Veillonella tobetsuensis]
MKQCKVDFHSSDSVEVMEELLLESIIKDMWEKLSQSERIALLSDLKDDIDNIDFNSIGGITSSMLIQVFRAGGFASYKITLIIVNAIAKAILGRGLSLAVNAGITSGLSVLVGPVGIILTALWSVYDIAGPAYRVIIPCTILIAAYRKMDSSNCQLFVMWSEKNKKWLKK